MHTDDLLKEFLDVQFLRSWKKIQRRSCRDLHIYRRHSRLRWHIIWELILRCSNAISQRLHDIYERMNYCPLGSGALAGTTYPLDREYTAELIGLLWTDLKQHGWCVRPGLSDRILISYVNHYDASEPFLRRRSLSGIPMNISL